VVAGESARWFESPRLATRNTHGTGCVLSAAIALRLAHGDAIAVATARARRFLLSCLRAGRNTPWGAGAGPAAGNLPSRRRASTT
jgi:hydroxymethylpyrimidine/phosphomethylpyrimidine kinase